MKVFRNVVSVDIEFDAANADWNTIEEAQAGVLEISKDRNLIIDILASLPCHCPEHWVPTKVVSRIVSERSEEEISEVAAKKFNMPKGSQGLH